MKAYMEYHNTLKAPTEYPTFTFDWVHIADSNSILLLQHFECGIFTCKGVFLCEVLLLLLKDLNSSCIFIPL